MDKLTKAFLQMRDLDDLAMKDSLIHNLNPLLKMISSLLFIICVLSTTYYDILELLVYFIIILIISYFSKMKFRSIFKRSLIGIPISLCLGISNLILLNEQVVIYSINIRLGLLSCLVILIKTILCLSIIFILISTTKFDTIASELVHVKVPPIFVLQLTITYRYIFVLLDEARIMSRAYLLRNPDKSAIQFKDMGSFIGNLLVRSFKQSSDVYNCMKCRGFDVNITYFNYQIFGSENYFLLMMIFSSLIIIKVVI